MRRPIASAGAEKSRGTDRRSFYVCNHQDEDIQVFPTLMAKMGSCHFRKGKQGIARDDTLGGELREVSPNEREMALVNGPNDTAAVEGTNVRREKRLRQTCTQF